MLNFGISTHGSEITGAVNSGVIPASTKTAVTNQ